MVIKKKTFYRLVEEIQFIFIDINTEAVTDMIISRLFKQKWKKKPQIEPGSWGGGSCWWVKEEEER